VVLFRRFQRFTNQPRWLPFAEYNLWRNPFGELTREERVELAIISKQERALCVLSQLEAVQLIGNCGNGKTTRMLAFHQQLPDSSYVYLPEDEPCPSIPVGNPVLVDEAQRLPRKEIKQLFSSGMPLILATHRDLRKRLQRYGYSVKTITIGEGNTTEHVQAVLNRRIEASRLGPGPVPKIDTDEASLLHQAHGTDIRSIERELYHQFQNQVIQYA